MKAMVFLGHKKFEIQDIATPKPNSDRVVLKVIAAGVCGSDIDGYARENGRRFAGQIMGHEAVGVVADATKENANLLGMSMTFTPIIACGNCHECARGADNLCASRQLIGVHPDVPGAFAEYVQVPVKNLFPAKSSAISTLAEPLSVIWQAINAFKNLYDGNVLILGAGTIGSLTAFTLRTRDKKVVDIFDPLMWKADWLTEFGISNLKALPPEEGIIPLQTNSKSYGVVIDCVGNTQTLNSAIALVTPGGHVHIVGMAVPKVELNIQMLVKREVTLTTSYAYRRDIFNAVATALPNFADSLEGIGAINCSLDNAPERFASLLDEDNRIKKLVIVP